MSDSMVGATVKFARMPEWVIQLPEESRRVFEFCLGRSYRVREIACHGLLVLDLGAEVESRFGGFGNEIRLEAEFLERMD